MRSCRWILAALVVLGGNAATALPSFQGLGELPGGAFFSFANAVSGDGTVVVGHSGSIAGTEAFRWTWRCSGTPAAPTTALRLALGLAGLASRSWIQANRA